MWVGVDCDRVAQYIIMCKWQEDGSDGIHSKSVKYRVRALSSKSSIHIDEWYWPQIG